MRMMKVMKKMKINETKRNTDNHMINKNKNKFQVSIEEDRKTQPELARTE